MSNALHLIEHLSHHFHLPRYFLVVVLRRLGAMATDRGLKRKTTDEGKTYLHITYLGRLPKPDKRTLVRQALPNLGFTLRLDLVSQSTQGCQISGPGPIPILSPSGGSML